MVRNSDEWSRCVSTSEGNNVDGDPMYWTVASLNGLRDEKGQRHLLIAEAPELYQLAASMTGDRSKRSIRALLRRLACTWQGESKPR